MQFLKTAFWVVLAVLIAIFTFANIDTYVPVNLGIAADLNVRLPFLVIVPFLAGCVPMWVVHRISRWTMSRRLDSAERALASVKPAYPPPPPPPAFDSVTDQP